MALTPVRIPALQAGRAIVDNRGAPATDFQRWINDGFKQLQNAQNATNAALVAAGIATAAAAAANAAADSVTSEQSLALSYVLEGSFAGLSPLEVDSAGNVTVKPHTRRYYDYPATPDVALTGGLVATGALNPDRVRIFYDDPTRANTNPAFQFTVDPAAPPVQGNDRHVIGAADVPAAGTSDGGYVRPPGFTGPIP